MLTVDLDRLRVAAGDRLLDMGCGGGRHAFAALRRGARVVAFDADGGELKQVRDMADAMVVEGEVPSAGAALAVQGDALALPFGDGAFDRIIAAEVLEHIPDAALAEIHRVLAPSGTLALSVPRAWPERLCWRLSRQYASTPGGHVRIYRGRELERRLRQAGFVPVASHHAHSLHTPFWWLKCLVGLNRKDVTAVKLYERFLTWEVMRRPAGLQLLDRLLNPLLGKSLVVYCRKAA